MFGNSWQVIGIMIIAILLMALANFVVRQFQWKGTGVGYVFLLLTLVAGWAVARAGGLPSNWVGRLGLAILVSCPMFFSGIVFSTLLRARGGISGMMAMNLLGAMCGGLLEYNSMYFGFRFLYILAAGLYLIAFVSERLGGQGEGLG